MSAGMLLAHVLVGSGMCMTAGPTATGSYPVPEVGAGCNPVELLVGIWEVLEISTEELLLQAQSRRHLLAVIAQQEPPVHVNELWGKSNRRSSGGATECIRVLMLQKSKSQSSRNDDNRLTISHAS